MPYLKRLAPVPEPIDCKILTAALELFVKKGYHTVSVHQIQSLANVSIGSIYNHFGGKEGIAKALYLHLCAEFDELVDDGIASSLSPREQCKKVIQLMFEYTESHPDIMAYLLNIRHVEFLSDQQLLCDTVGFIKIGQIIQAGIDAGEFRAMEPIIATSCIFGGAIRMVQLRLDGLIKQPLPNVLEQAIAATFSGVCELPAGLHRELAVSEQRSGVASIAV